MNTTNETAAGGAKVMLKVDDLKVHFSARSAFGRKRTVYAVDGVSLQVRENEALGIIGESGCGKTTTGRAIVRLTAPTSGRITLDGEDISDPTKSRLHELRQVMQFVFQDPYSSLNPRMTIKDILAEPLHAFGQWNRRTGPTRLAELLDQVGMSSDALRRYPHEFSGGQRQRIGLARALALNPALVVLDEPVSALDVSVQAQVLNLLLDLRQTSRVAFIMISHDLEVIRHVTDRVSVMYLGKIVENGPSDVVLDSPAHPYTKALVSAVPTARLHDTRERIILTGDLPSPSAPPSGCRFRTRCWLATEKCANEEPLLQPVGDPADHRQVACHYPLEVVRGRPVVGITGKVA